MKFIVTLALISLFVLGCGTSINTPFQGNPKDSPIENKVTTPGEGLHCKADSAGKYPGDNLVITQKGKDGDISVGEGGGCVLRPLRETWAVLQNKKSIKWDSAKDIGFKRVETTEADFLFEIKLEAGPSPFTQNWVMHWFQSVKAGTIKAPEKVVINYKKVLGTSFIKHWQGTIELKALTPTVTDFIMYNAIDAAQTGPEEAAGSIGEVLTKLRTGEPDYSFLGAL